MQHFRSLYLVASSMVLLAACAANTSQNRQPDLTFQQTQAQPVFVAQYSVQPVPAEQRGSMPQGFVADPAKAVEDYFMRRYKAAGSQGQLMVSINNISVTQDVEKSESSIGQFLNVDKQDKYTIQATIRLLASNINGFNTQYVDIHAQQMISLSEHISLAKREKMQAEAIQDLVQQLDAEAQKVLRNEFRIAGSF